MKDLAYWERGRPARTERETRTRRPRSRGGFALLITVTLLAFIVVLLVGLAVYTRVETAAAGNTQRQAQARENALFALNVALGQLQKYAGPDQRVTATAESFVPAAAEGETAANVNVQKLHYTGVWDTTKTGDEYKPTWLVSGIEVPNSTENITQSVTSARSVTLVGTATDGSATANNTVATLQDIKANGIPGTAPSTSTTIGRYAWWVGDQGVKAPVAVADATSAVNYAPYDSADLRARIRQQLAIGAGAADTTGAPLFEPRDSNNSSLVAKIAATNQIAFLHPPSSSTAQLGPTNLRNNFHAWSPNNFAVLANTKTGGLRQDLSLKPDLLGSAFAAWADYPSYMEDPASATATPSIVPSYGSDPLRRRYIMTPHTLDGGGSHQVGPVLADFGITFNVCTVETSPTIDSALQVRAAWMMSLWNPYTSSLVPEDIRVKVSGLPRVSVVDAASTAVVSQFSLQNLYADSSGALVIALPWDSQNLPTGAPEEDRKSWLPGRVYTWRSLEDTSKGVVPDGGFPSRFYTRSFVAQGETNQGVQRSIPGTAHASDMSYLTVQNPVPVTVTLYVIRDGEERVIGSFVGPPFATSFETTQREIGDRTYQFGIAFRLKESVDNLENPSEWLTTPTIDFRRRQVPGDAFVRDRGDDNPAVYENRLTDFMTAKPDRLLFRAGTSYSYNEDVPLFELPRAPLLSLGALQHFRIVARRPFMIGNSWGTAETLNNIPLGSLFDRFYFSGLVPSVTPATTTTGDLITPNPLLKPLRKADGTKVTIDDVRAMATDGDGRSSKFFLQGGAFNLNSTRVNAWAAVLRGVRFPAPQAFTYLDADETTGTAADTATATVQGPEAQFFRFSQSAQETYKAEAGKSGGTAQTELFRRGMRTLTNAQVSALANAIVDGIKARHAASGPFRSLEEFLSPASTDAPSLLEKAIADAGINASVPEFSSQFLTQADIMTALAPVLFPRSDTFLIRAYGEALNPATSTTAAPVVEGRAWCEALVQRVPEYFDPSDAPETAAGDFDLPSDPNEPNSQPTAAHQLNKLYGRRFKVISFRWLTRADI